MIIIIFWNGRGSAFLRAGGGGGEDEDQKRPTVAPHKGLATPSQVKPKGLSGGY